MAGLAEQIDATHQRVEASEGALVAAVVVATALPDALRDDDDPVL